MYDIPDDPGRAGPPDELPPYQDPMDLEPPENDTPTKASFKELAMNTAVATAVGKLAVYSLPNYPTLSSPTWSARDMLALLNEAVREGVAIGEAFATVEGDGR